MMDRLLASIELLGNLVDILFAVQSPKHVIFLGRPRPALATLHFTFAFSPNSTSRRMASDSDGMSGWFSARRWRMGHSRRRWLR
jgi:hypothetical protein